MLLPFTHVMRVVRRKEGKRPDEEIRRSQEDP